MSITQLQILSIKQTRSCNTLWDKWEIVIKKVLIQQKVIQFSKHYLVYKQLIFAKFEKQNDLHMKTLLFVMKDKNSKINKNKFYNKFMKNY